MKTTTVYVKPLPTVGEVIYVPPVSNRVKGDYRGGGKATVERIEEGVNGNGPTHFVIIKEFPKRMYQYDWFYLARVQEPLCLQYGDTEARFTTKESA